MKNQVTKFEYPIMLLQKMLVFLKISAPINVKPSGEGQATHPRVGGTGYPSQGRDFDFSSCTSYLPITERITLGPGI